MRIYTFEIYLGDATVLERAAVASSEERAWNKVRRSLSDVERCAYIRHDLYDVEEDDEPPFVDSLSPEFEAVEDSPCLQSADIHGTGEGQYHGII